MVTLCNPVDYSTPGFLSFAISHSWLKLMTIKLVMPSNHLILCRPLLLLPSIFPSIKVFSKESVLHIRWPNIGDSASTSVFPMNTQDWSPLGWSDWISLQSKGLARVFSNESALRMRWPKYWSFSFSIIPSKNPRADLLQNGLVGSPCSPRDSQEFSPTPQFKSINSSALSFLHSPALTSIHDHRKNHSLDWMNLCW